MGWMKQGQGRGRGRKKAREEINSETSESSDGEMEEGEWALTGLDKQMNADAQAWGSQNMALKSGALQPCNTCK